MCCADQLTAAFFTPLPRVVKPPFGYPRPLYFCSLKTVRRSPCPIRYCSAMKNNPPPPIGRRQLACGVTIKRESMVACAIVGISPKKITTPMFRRRHRSRGRGDPRRWKENAVPEHDDVIRRTPLFPPGISSET